MPRKDALAKPVSRSAKRVTRVRVIAPWVEAVERALGHMDEAIERTPPLHARDTIVSVRTLLSDSLNRAIAQELDHAA